MGHGAAPPLLYGQSGLGAIQRLNLALFVDGEHDGMSGGIDIQADDVAQLGGELRIVGQLELAHSMRLQAVGTPNALRGAEADADDLRHRPARPVRDLAGRLRQSEGDDALGYIRRQGRDTRRPCLVPQQAVYARLHEPLLPAPHGTFGLAGAAHDLAGAATVRRQQDDLRPPDMLLWTVPVRHDRFETSPISGADLNDDTWAHPSDSHAHSLSGIPFRILPSGSIH